MERNEKLDAVNRMQSYIEQNLSIPISLLDLARCAGYSPFHSARIFKELTGKTPFDYIRALRLSRAALALRDGNARVVDVALDFVFDSHEGFTRAFTREFGMPPQKYRRNPPPIKLFMPYLVGQHPDPCEGVKTMGNHTETYPVFVQVIDRPRRKLILKRGIKAEHYFEYCEEVGCDAWGVLTSVKEALYEPIGMWMPAKLRTPGTSLYTQGVEVPADYAGEVPEGFELIDLAPCKMMVFQGPPFEDELYSEAIGELWKIMKTYNPELYGFEWADEDAPRFQLAPQGYRGYIEARPVRQMNKG